MADFSPFNPEYSPQEEVKQDPAGLADRWRSFLGDPASRAALMSFGAQLSQPVAPGNNWAGHIGQATGAAGEAATKAFSLEQGDIEKESKQIAREQAANTAVGKLEVMQQRANSDEMYKEARNRLAEEQAATQASVRARNEASARALDAAALAHPDKVEAAKLSAQANMLRAETGALVGGAQAGYLGARTDAVPQLTAIAQDRQGTREKEANTRQLAERNRNIRGVQELEERVRRGDIRDLATLRGQYITATKDDVLFNRKSPPFEEWIKKFPELMRGGGAARSTAPAPQQQQPQAPQQQPQEQPRSPLQNAGGGSDPEAQWHQRSDGRMWMKSPDGRWFVQ